VPTSGQELTLSLLATIMIEIVSFRSYEYFPTLLPFCKCILQVMFYVDVQHRLRLYLDHLNGVKMAAF
jgi:hypothetical protein